MNLAGKDIRHNLGRFALTTIGVGMLLMIVMGMGGIYRGIIEDATLLIVGKETYTVVGRTANMLGSGGDAIAFVTTLDAMAIQFDTAGEAVRLEREARRARAANVAKSAAVSRHFWNGLISRPPNSRRSRRLGSARSWPRSRQAMMPNKLPAPSPPGEMLRFTAATTNAIFCWKAPSRKSVGRSDCFVSS